MEYLNSIFISIFQAVMLIIVAKIIANVKFYLRDYLAVAGIIVPSAVLFVVFGRQSIIFLLIICLIYFYVKIGFYSIIAILGSALIMYISNFFSVSLIILIGNFIKFRIIYVIISLSSYILIGVLCAFMTKYLINKLKKTYLFFNKVYIIVISTFLTFTIAIFYLYSLKFQQTYQEWKLFALLFIGILIFLAIFIIVITFSVHREMQYKRNLKEIETYYEYTLQIESINNEMRKFRHDYVNILSTMSEYIREDDMPGLREYFNNNIVSMKDNLQMNSIKINGTDKLKVRAIKGLVTTKILQAQEKKHSHQH